VLPTGKKYSALGRFPAWRHQWWWCPASGGCEWGAAAAGVVGAAGAASIPVRQPSHAAKGSSSAERVSRAMGKWTNGGCRLGMVLEKAVHHEEHREHEGKRTDFINFRNHPSGGAENPRMVLQLRALRGLCGELNCRF